MGEFYVREGQRLIASGEYDRALHQLRSGVTRAPGSAAGRIALARLYVAFRRVDLAASLLEDGLPFLPADTSYVREVLRFFLEFQFDTRLGEICARLLRQTPNRPDRFTIALHAAAASYHRGNYDQAETLIQTHHLLDQPDGALLQARIDWERGYPTLALARLRDLEAAGFSDEPLYQLIGQIQRQLGQMRDLEITLTQRLAAAPLAHGPRLEFLYLYHEQVNASKIESGLASFFKNFAHDQSALNSIADFAANTGRPEVARHVQQLCREQHWSEEAAALMCAEAYVVAGRYREGLDLIRRYNNESPAWTKQFATAFDGLQAVALLGLSRPDEAKLHLDHLLAQPNLRAENLVAVAQRITKLGAANLARSALTRAIELDPLNQAALSTLVEIETTEGNFDTLPTHVRSLLAMRKPSPAVLAAAANRFGSDLNLLHPEQITLLGELRTALDKSRQARL